jgi:hypothetical protein
MRRINLSQMSLFFVLSVIITFVLFYALSWYSFNTFPTSVVFQRMVISITALMIILFAVTSLIKKLK